jgi:hypothetical protein
MYHNCKDGPYCAHGLPQPARLSDNDLHSLILSYEVLAGKQGAVFASEVVECLRELRSLRTADTAALLSVLREIVHHYDQTYDADCEPGGSWAAAASIPVAVMERAEALVKKHS